MQHGYPIWLIYTVHVGRRNFNCIHGRGSGAYGVQSLLAGVRVRLGVRSCVRPPCFSSFIFLSRL